jgi:hypothetical protein
MDKRMRWQRWGGRLEAPVISGKGRPNRTFGCLVRSHRDRQIRIQLEIATLLHRMEEVRSFIASPILEQVEHLTRAPP